MLKRFIPDMYQESIFTINYKKLKKQGIKCILVDLDNTISPAKEVIFCEKTKKLFDKLKKDFKIVLFSNNFPKRISKFGNYYSVDIACISLKPFSYKYRYILTESPVAWEIYSVKKESGIIVLENNNDISDCSSFIYFK